MKVLTWNSFFQTCHNEKTYINSTSPFKQQRKLFLLAFHSHGYTYSTGTCMQGYKNCNYHCNQKPAKSLNKKRKSDWTATVMCKSSTCCKFNFNFNCVFKDKNSSSYLSLKFQLMLLKNIVDHFLDHL